MLHSPIGKQPPVQLTLDTTCKAVKLRLPKPSKADMFCMKLYEQIFSVGRLEEAAGAYRRQLKRILTLKHPISNHMRGLPSFDSHEYVSSLFAFWKPSFRAWVNPIDAKHKRGKHAKDNGSGVAALKKMYEHGEANVQAIFDAL